MLQDKTPYDRLKEVFGGSVDSRELGLTVLEDVELIIKVHKLMLFYSIKLKKIRTCSREVLLKQNCSNREARKKIVWIRVMVYAYYLIKESCYSVGTLYHSVSVVC